MIRRLLAAPALHFACAGALLFALTLGMRPAVPERPRLVASDARLAEARRAFEAEHRRPPIPAEDAVLARQVVDEEVLLQHALDFGLADQEPVQRRLAQISGFVAEDPARVLELGLHRDDLVVRRILVDSARRLIRSAVLLREPSEAVLKAHLKKHPERFEQPEEIRIAVLPEGETAGETKELPLLLRRDLERRFGRSFTETLDATRVGEQQGPLPSRLGPLRVVVREHRPARPAMLAEVYDAVHADLREELADLWLEVRIAGLRAEMGGGGS